MNDDTEFGSAIKTRFAQLPKVVQKAIMSADVETHLRELASTHKLHLDQWEALENEVQLTLLGIQPTDKLAKNIAKEVGVSAEVAQALAIDIAGAIFQPIREELERELGNSEQRTENSEQRAASGNLENREQRTGSGNSEQAPATQVPSTPPPAPATEKAIRAPISPEYSSKPSHERMDAGGDPYREPIQ